MRNLATLTFIAIFALFCAAPANAKADPTNKTEAEKIVRTLGSTAIRALTNPSFDADQKIKEFQKILEEGFDTKTIGRFVIGTYWRDMNKSQKKEYLTLFERLITQKYANQFQDYTNASFEITGSRVEGDESYQDIFVTTKLNSKELQNPLLVEWRLTPRPTLNPASKQETNALKIIDVIVEGVSMSITQREEFTAYIDRNGESVEALLTMLREKTK